MGNNCEGNPYSTPNRQDISVFNETPFKFLLNENFICDCENKHKGFKVLKHEKFIEGYLPSKIIDINSKMDFSISSRSNSIIRPKVELS